MLAANEFARYHALGNDYLVMDEDTAGALPPERIVAICHRHFGVGSDGILLRVAARQAAFGLRILNPDGSEAEKSGNGLRIFARCMVDLGYTQERLFTVETPGGTVRAELHGDAPKIDAITVDMGQASFESSAVYVAGPARTIMDEPLQLAGESIRINAVSMGNPHCVCLVPHLDVAQLRRLGPALENHPMFAQRTNVQLVRVVNRQRLDILIWERGAGETMASGSSSCAAAAVARRADLVDSVMQVHMPGGVLHIEIEADFAVRMRGPATPICRGVLVGSLAA